MKSQLITALVCLAFLSACSSFVGEKLLKIRMGSTVTEVTAADGDLVEPTPVKIQNDGLSSKSEYSMLISTLRAANNDNYWIYAFKDNKLIYWGYPYQFLRSEDKELRSFGEVATKYLVAKKYLKETLE